MYVYIDKYPFLMNSSLSQEMYPQVNGKVHLGAFWGLVKWEHCDFVNISLEDGVVCPILLFMEGNVSINKIRKD